GAELKTVSPGFLTKFLNTLIDPNIISLLFLAGLAGIGYEIFHPGVVLPGALGAVCLLTALFGFSVLPLSWAGLFLVLLGVALLVILVVVLFLLVLFLVSALKVAREYERGIVFRLGRLFPEPKGPGLFILIPIVDRMVRVDLRTITLQIPPQEVITKDNVPVR